MSYQLIDVEDNSIVIESDNLEDIRQWLITTFYYDWDEDNDGNIDELNLDIFFKNNQDYKLKIKQ